MTQTFTPDQVKAAIQKELQVNSHNNRIHELKDREPGKVTFAFRIEQPLISWLKFRFGNAVSLRNPNTIQINN